jgi:hypothetical protein
MAPQIVKCEAPRGLKTALWDNGRAVLYAATNEGIVLKITGEHNVGDPPPAPKWYMIELPR